MRQILLGFACAVGTLAAVSCASVTFSNYSDRCWSITAYKIKFDCETYQASSGGVYIDKKHPSCANLTKFQWEAGFDWDKNQSIDSPAGPQLCIPNPTPPFFSGQIQIDASEARGRQGEFRANWAVFVAGQDKPLASDSATQPFGGD